MIPYILIILLLTSCAQVDTERTEYSIERATVVYNLDDISLNPTVSDIVYMNEHVDGITVKENTLKLHDACYSDKLYAATIQSPNLAVYDDSISYIDTQIAPNDFRLKYVKCGMDNVYIAESPYSTDITEVELVRLHNGELSRARFDANTIISAARYVEELGLLFVPSDNGIIVLDETMVQVGVLDHQLYTVLFNGENILAIESRSRDNVIEYFEYDTDFNLVDQSSFQVKGQTRYMIYDTMNNLLWVTFEDDTIQSVHLESGNVGTRLDIVPDANNIAYDSGYVAVLTEKGYDTDDDGGYLGGLSIIDTAANTVKTVKLLHHHTGLSMKGGYAYVTNNDDNSVSKIDLGTGEISEVIDLGNSAEHVVVDRHGTAYVASRLGGSTVFTVGDTVTEVDVGSWPVGMVYDESLDKVFTYNMLSASITEVGTRDVELPVPEAASDAIGHMSLDETRDLLIISVPEYMQVYLVDAVSLKLRKIIDVPGKASNAGGPGQLQSFMHEASGTLLVYDAIADTLHYYDGTTAFTLRKSIPVSKNRGVKLFPYGLYMDQANNRLFIGDTAYSLDGSMTSYGHGGYVAAVLQNDIVYVTVDEKGQEWLHAGDKIMLGKDNFIASRSYYRDGTLYIVYGVEAQLMKISLS